MASALCHDPICTYMIRKSTSELSIKPKMSSQMRLAILLASGAMIIVLLVLSYQAGVKAGHEKIEEDRATIGRLNNSIEELRANLDESDQNLIVAQRHQQIQEEAYQQINAAYASAERKNSYLGSRLDFYRSIISPESGAAGPAIQSLEATPNEAGIDFDITLVQAIKHKHQVRGTLEVSMVASDGSALIWPQGSPRSVNYQYFEQISGTFEGARMSDNAKITVKLSLQDGEQLVREFRLSAVVANNE